MRDSLGAHLDAIGRVPLLTDREELELGRAVRAWLDAEEPTTAVVRRGKRARDRMVAANLRLVVVVARKYQRHLRHLELVDLIQEGTLGLVRGVERFDPARGYKLSTYAYWWIQQAIGRARAYLEHGGIRVPINARDTEAAAMVARITSLDASALEDGSPLHEAVAAPEVVGGLEAAAALEEVLELAPADLVPLLEAFDDGPARRDERRRLEEELGCSRTAFSARLNRELARLRPLAEEVLSA